jgi:hypothetical protein
VEYERDCSTDPDAVAPRLSPADEAAFAFRETPDAVVSGQWPVVRKTKPTAKPQAKPKTTAKTKGILPGSG